MLYTFEDFQDSTLHKSEVTARIDESKGIPLSTNFDVFISHSYKDKALILKVLKFFESKGLKAYVDWDTDSELDRSRVTEKTANRLRHRMNNSNALIYIATENSQLSTWVPWELGYMDALTKKIAIFPISHSKETLFRGREYLNLYPYISKALTTAGTTETYVEVVPWKYTSFNSWLAGRGLQKDAAFENECKNTMSKATFLLAKTKEMGF